MNNSTPSRRQRESFAPGPLALLTSPFFLARRELAHAMRRFAPRLSGRLLDVGCGQKPYRHLFPVADYIGMEYDSPENRQSKPADVFYDGHHFPFPDGEFDACLATQVLEHVFTPDAFLEEIRRILKPGGLLLLTVPFVWDEHEQPHDFARYSSFGLRHLLEQHGFAIREQHKTGASLALHAQLWNCYIHKRLQARHRLWRALAMLLLMAPANLLGLLAHLLLPHNPDAYLDNVILAQRLPH